jgi:hypothetical protein
MATNAFRMFSSTPRRVRKSEVQASTIRAVDPYAVLMACWVDFMNVDDRDLGSRGMRLKGDCEDDRTVNDHQRLADIKTGESVNAMVDSLTTIHRWAIYKSQGIASAWRFQNADYETVLLEARDDLEKKLRTHIATRLYFS